MSARIRVLLILWLVLAVFLLVGALAATKPARAHDALPTAAKPHGWSYPLACCSGYDCREVTGGPEGLIRELNNGYEIATTGEIIPLGDSKLKPSPDGQYHWCSRGGKDDGKTICLFVPPAAF